MKIKINLLITLVFAFFLFTACSSIISPPYTFSENEKITNARLTIGRGISLIDIDGTVPREGTGSIAYMLPAEEEMDIRVYVFWKSNAPGSRRRGIFKCPPLEAGREYRLSFNVKTSGIFIERPADGYSIVLEKRQEGRTIQYERVNIQVIPPFPD